MRYVVVREIEGTHRDSLVFPALEDARDYDGQAAYVCMEQPDDTPGGDPSMNRQHCLPFAFRQRNLRPYSAPSDTSH